MPYVTVACLGMNSAGAESTRVGYLVQAFRSPSSRVRTAGLPALPLLQRRCTAEPIFEMRRLMAVRTGKHRRVLNAGGKQENRWQI